jgi:hypothetical protein
LCDESLLESFDEKIEGESNNGGREFLDYKELYLNSEIQVDEIRRVYRLEIKNYEGRFEGLIREFEGERRRWGRERERLEESLGELDGIVKGGDERFKGEKMKDSERIEELKSLVVILKERLEEEYDNKESMGYRMGVGFVERNGMATGRSEIEAVNAELEEKLIKSEKKNEVYEKYLKASITKVIEVFEILVIYEKDGVKLDRFLDSKIETSLLELSKDTIDNLEIVDVVTFVKQILLKFFDKSAALISKFKMDTELYRIIAKYKQKFSTGKKPEPPLLGKIEVGPTSNFMATSCADSNSFLGSNSKSVSQNFHLEAEDRQSQMVGDNEIVEQFRNYYFEENKKDLDLFYNGKYEGNDESFRERIDLSQFSGDGGIGGVEKSVGQVNLDRMFWSVENCDVGVKERSKSKAGGNETLFDSEFVITPVADLEFDAIFAKKSKIVKHGPTPRQNGSIRPQEILSDAHSNPNKENIDPNMLHKISFPVPKNLHPHPARGAPTRPSNKSLKKSLNSNYKKLFHQSSPKTIAPNTTIISPTIKSQQSKPNPKTNSNPHQTHPNHHHKECTISSNTQ